eukprot:6317018-Amphidinium_carterae.2
MLHHETQKQTDLLLTLLAHLCPVVVVIHRSLAAHAACFVALYKDHNPEHWYITDPSKANE